MLLPLVTFAALASPEPRTLTVEEALAALEAHNPSLARASAGVASARGGSVASLSAVLPTVAVSGSYTRNNAEATMDLGELFEILGDVAKAMGNTPPEPPGELVLQPLSAFTGAASLRVPLIQPAGWAQLGAAHDGVRAAEAQQEALGSSLRASARQAFWGAAGAEALVGAQEASVERARTLVTTAQRAFDAGTSTRLSVLEAQTDLARREADLVLARAAVEKARIAIGVVLGSPDPVRVALGDEAGSLATASVEEAWAGRAEVRAAELQVEAARAQLWSTRLGALPTLSGGFLVSASSEPYVTGENVAWKATLDLTWPLVAGGARLGAEDRAQAALADAEAAVEAARLQVAQQVQVALADRDAAVARLALAGRQRTLAEEAATVAQRSFDEGVADLRAVLDALDRLDLAHAGEIDARARRGAAEAALQGAVGRW